MIVGIIVLAIGAFSSHESVYYQTQTVDCKGFTRYFRIQAALISGRFPLARFSIVFVSSTTALLAAVVFGVLVHAVR